MTTLSDPTRRSAVATNPRAAPFPPCPPCARCKRLVDPDSWLDALHGWHVERKVDAHGMVKLERTALLRREQAGGPTSDLAAGCEDPLSACRTSEPSTSNPCRSHEVLAPDSLGGCQQGLVGHLLTFDQFLTHMRAQAKAEHRLRSEAPNVGFVQQLSLLPSSLVLLACSATRC
jgi:hypothetical protein